jgi:5'-nucleotidase
MKILLSNDDGYDSEGIIQLYNVLSSKHEVYIFCPCVNRSASSSCLSVKKDLKIEKKESNHYTVDGTPADSVHIGLNYLSNIDFDLVIAGINSGPNLGDDVIYSGTVAAAIEGRHLKNSPIAVSLVNNAEISFKDAAEIFCFIFEKEIIGNKYLEKTIININIPKKPNPSEISYTKLGYRGLPKPAIKINEDFYQIGDAGIPVGVNEGTDFYAVRKGHVSITPITLDLTNYKILESIKNER